MSEPDTWTFQKEPEEPSFERIEELRCPNCGVHYRYLPEQQEEWYKNRAESYIKAFEEEFYKEIEELQEMFPDTPIREFMEERSRKLVRALSLLKKRIVDKEKLTFSEECELDNIMSEL